MRNLLGFSLLASALAGCAFPKVVDTSTRADGAVADSAADVVGMDAIDDVADSGVIVVPDVIDVQREAAADVVNEPLPDVVVEACAPSGAEVCDGVDNDCDGTVDNVSPAMLVSNNAHCGRCGNSCGANECSVGVCTPFRSDGSEGAFNPPAGMVTTLAPGVHQFTTITIPATAIVRISAGSGVLDLRATGAVNILGEIDLSGGNGGNSAGTSGMTPGCNNMTHAGGAHGGAAGLGRGAVASQVNGCVGTNAAIGNAVDVMGAGGDGSESPHMGACPGVGGRNGGGAAGGRRGSGGGGGGGAAGGGGGAAFFNMTAADRQNISGGTGGRLGMSNASPGGRSMCTASTCTVTGGGVGEAMLGASAGATATLMLTGAAFLAAASGGGGATMGRDAFGDFAINRLTPGSSGGAGGGGGDPCPGFGYSYGVGGGGGGGGGALRIASTASIIIGAGAVVRVNGGDGGNGTNDIASGGGGGGSGGALDLRAPSLTVSSTATVTAAGGAGGVTTHPNGGNGGNGGPGRIRLAFDASGACTIAPAAFSHTFAGANPCDVARTSALRTVFVTRFPE
jgi:hypothetical protein